MLEGKLREIIYEGLEAICGECKVYGHRGAACPKVRLAKAKSSENQKKSRGGGWHVVENKGAEKKHERETTTASQNQFVVLAEASTQETDGEAAKQHGLAVEQPSGLESGAGRKSNDQGNTAESPYEEVVDPGATSHQRNGSSLGSGDVAEAPIRDQLGDVHGRDLIVCKDSDGGHRVGLRDDAESREGKGLPGVSGVAKSGGMKEGEHGTISRETMVSTEENESLMKDGGYKKRGRPVRSGKAKIKVESSGKVSQGAANADLGRQLRFLISKYHIKLLVLVETKTSGEKCLKLRRRIGFDSSFVEEASGFSGGIWVLWTSQEVQFTAVYGSPREEERKVLWDCLDVIADLSSPNYSAMAEKVTIMRLKVDLQCEKCYKKVKKVLCKFPQIREQVFDEKKNIVTIKVVCCSPEKIRDQLCCKGCGAIKSIEIVPRGGSDHGTGGGGGGGGSGGTGGGGNCRIGGGGGGSGGTGGGGNCRIGGGGGGSGGTGGRGGGGTGGGSGGCDGGIGGGSNSGTGGGGSGGTGGGVGSGGGGGPGGCGSGGGGGLGSGGGGGPPPCCGPCSERRPPCCVPCSERRPPCCVQCREGRRDGPCYPPASKPALPPPPPSVPTCCVQCWEGRRDGPCFDEYCRPPPCYQGYFFARPVYDSYSGGRPCYVSRCDQYYNEDNATGCKIM
ncbi:hypothetical protein K1719_004171 [Acacia pycnantha]|nr:hypothetical protein K1719_004171 [Acacia pycnantha]